MQHESLGQRVRDTVTGFRGKITARTIFLIGEPQVLVEAWGANGDPHALWLHERRVELLDDHMI